MKPLNTYLTEGEIKKSRLAEPTAEDYLKWLGKGNDITPRELESVLMENGWKITFSDRDVKKYGIKDIFIDHFFCFFIYFEEHPHKIFSYEDFYDWIHEFPNRPFMWSKYPIHGVIDPPIKIDSEKIGNAIKRIKRYIYVSEQAKDFVTRIYGKYGADKDADMSQFSHFLAFVRGKSRKLVHLNDDDMRRSFIKLFNEYYIDNYEEDLKRLFPKFVKKYLPHTLLINQ